MMVQKCRVEQRKAIAKQVSSCRVKAKSGLPKSVRLQQALAKKDRFMSV